MIYLSYHNIDLKYAFRIASLLIRYYRRVWLDRFEVSPLDDWDESISQIVNQATGAIVIVSDDYLETEYCRGEYQRLRERGIPISAIIARDFSTENIAEFKFDDWIDFRRWFDEPNDLSVEYLLNQVPQAEGAQQVGDRTEYLHQFIASTELSLAKVSTAMGSLQRQPSKAALSTRPRGYCDKLLQSWELICHKDNTTYQIENLYHWAASEEGFVLSGDAGSGKTVFAQLLALAQAHQALIDPDGPLPIWLDLMKWDQGYASLESFIEREWGLVSYWKHWLKDNQAIFFLDNITDLHRHFPAAFVELSQWARANSDHLFVLLSTTPEDAFSDWPILEIPRVSDHLALKFAASALTLDQLSSFRVLLRQFQAKIENNQLDYLSMGLELLVADKSLAVNQWNSNPLPALIKLRHRLMPTSAPGVSADALTVFLQTVAWSMMQLENHRRVVRSDIERQANARVLIDRAIELGILCEIGSGLRFQSESFQWYLAIDQLLADGAHKYLTRPQFTADGNRAPHKWDPLVLILADSAEDESRHQLIASLVDIDPFLAGQCLQRQPDSYGILHESLVVNAVALLAQNQTAQSAFRSCVHAIPNVEKSAEILAGQINRYDNAVQLLLWHEVLALPLDLPLSFVDAVADLDRESTAPIIDRFSEYPVSLLVSYLVKLTGNADAHFRSNAVWALGELKYLPSAVLLLDYLENSNRDDHDEIVLALMRFAYSDILSRLLRWSQANPAHLELVTAALDAGGRTVSSRLLRLANDGELSLNPAFYDLMVDHDELDLAIGMALIAQRHIPLPVAVKQSIKHGENAEQLHDRLSAAIGQLPKREHFQLLLADIQSVLQNPPESTIHAGSSLGVLLYGQRGFEDFNAQAEETTDSALPGALQERLRHDNWQERYDALSSLGNYPASLAIPHLLDLAADDETLVRLAALNALARFPDELAARKVIISTLSDADQQVIGAATELLKSMPGIDCDELMGLLDSGNPHTVAAVIEVLGKARHKPALPALSALLEDNRPIEDGDSTIGQRAAAAVKSIEADQASTIDAREVGSGQNGKPTDEDSVSRTASPDQQFTDEEKIRTTLQLLRDDDWGRTQKAAKFLRKFAKSLRNSEHSRTLELLCMALRDESWHVRWAVAEAIAWLQDAAAIPHLTDLLQDPNWIVQVAAIRALVQLDASEDAEHFLPLLQNPQKAVREAAAEALGELGNVVAVDALGLTAQNDGDYFVRFAALRSIHQIRPQLAREYLENALNDEFIHLRWYAMKALAPLMDEADIPLLKRMLDDDEKPTWEDESVRDLAAAALLRINTPESLAALDIVERLEDQTNP